MPAPISFGAEASYLQGMTNDRDKAAAEFRRMVKWIVVVAVAMVLVALLYLHLTTSLTANLIIATTMGVFFSRATRFGTGLRIREGRSGTQRGRIPRRAAEHRRMKSPPGSDEDDARRRLSW